MNVSIFQTGRLLHANRVAFVFDGLGEPTGTYGKTQCFASVALVDDRGRRRVVDGNTYGGGVTVCVRAGGRQHWYGIGSAKQIAAANVARLAKV